MKLVSLPIHPQAEDSVESGQEMAQLGQQGVVQAMAQAKAANAAIYYLQDSLLIKEFPDGTRFSVNLSADGSELLAPVHG